MPRRKGRADPGGKGVAEEKVAEPAKEAAPPAAEEDEDLEFELPAEEGKEPVRRKLSELWDGYDQSEKLKAEIEQLKSRSATVEPEVASALKDVVAERAKYMQESSSWRG